MLRLLLFSVAVCLTAGQSLSQDVENSLNVPPGFSVNVFSNVTAGARSLAISENTTYPGTILYVSTDSSVRHVPVLGLSDLQ